MHFYHDMKTYDVIIAGAGPAGGQCARILTQKGYAVLLLEKVADFSKNDFSSGGTPTETLNLFSLPKDVIGGFWNKIEVRTSKKHFKWKSKTKLGLILDFKKLRTFLKNEAVKTGRCDFHFGCTIETISKENSLSLVKIENSLTKTFFTVKSKVIVDATGPARSVIYHELTDSKPNLYHAVGLEYLIEIKKGNTLDDNSIHFLMGYHWMPRGYGWIFPMGKNLFKVGAGFIRYQSNVVSQPLKFYVEQIIREIIKPKEYKICDIHGSTAQVTLGHEELFFRDNIIAIGDAISTINYLGGEGIRHAMFSAQIGSEFVEKYLNGEICSFKGFKTRMKQYFGKKWDFAVIIDRIVYIMAPDWLFDWGFKLFTTLSATEMMDLLFGYHFSLGLKAIRKYIFRF